MPGNEEMILKQTFDFAPGREPVEGQAGVFRQPPKTGLPESLQGLFSFLTV